MQHGGQLRDGGALSPLAFRATRPQPSAAMPLVACLAPIGVLHLRKVPCASATSSSDVRVMDLRQLLSSARLARAQRGVGAQSKRENRALTPGRGLLHSHQCYWTWADVRVDISLATLLGTGK